MGFLGHLGAGAGFLGVGLWQAYVIVKAYRLNETSSSSRRPLSSQRFVRHTEHVVVAILAVLHMVFSVIASIVQNQNNGAPVGAAISIEKFGVAAVFFLYAVVALISEGTKALPLPAGIVELLAMFAFGEEFLLFYFTRGDEHSAGLESQYYSLLLVPIGVCLLATGTEIVYPTAILPPFVRSMALILQGNWFFQMAASLFTTKWMPQGCDLVQKSPGDYTVSCDGMYLMKGRALATLQFNCHLALLLVFLLPMYVLMCKLCTVPMNYERLGDNQVAQEGREIYQGDEIGQELSQADYFHMLEDEDEEDEVQEPKESPDTNGFQRVPI